MARIDEKGNFIEDGISTYTTIDSEGNLQHIPMPTRKKKKKENEWFDTGAFDDGYDFGDVTKTILGTAVNIPVNIAKGAADLGKGIGHLGAAGVAQIADWAGNDEWANQIRENISGKNEKYNELEKNLTLPGLLTQAQEATSKDSVLAKNTESILQGAGNYAGMAAAQAVGVPWQLTAGLSSAGSELSNAYANGAEDWEAWTSAAGNAAFEILSEYISGGAKLPGTGKTMEKLSGSLVDSIKNKYIKGLAGFGINMLGEGIEENVSGIASEMLRKLTYMKDDEKNLLANAFQGATDYLSQEALNDFIGGAVVSGLTMGVSPGTYQNIKTGRNLVSGLTSNEQKTIDELVDKRYNEAIENGEKTSKSKIEGQVKSDLEKGYIDLEEIEKTLGGDTYTQYQEELQKQEDIQKQIDKYKKMKDNDITVEQREEYNKLREELSNQTKTVENLGKQLRSYVNELTQNDTLLRNSYDEYNNKGVAYNVDLSQIDEKYRDTYQRAMDSGVLNNTNRSHDFVDLLAKLENDKGVKFDFTNNEKIKETGFALEGKNIGGFINGDKIALNMDSNEALNQVVGHEITHILEDSPELYEALSNSIKEYVESTGKSYKDLINATKEKYTDKNGNLIGNADIVKELNADLVGKYLFTDEEFINRLSTQNRNLFQKIYDEIKYLSRLITSGSKEGRQLEKLKHTFEKVYRQTTENQSTNTKYMLSKNALQDVASIVVETQEQAKNNPNQFAKLKDNTVKSLVDYGIEDLPMLAKRGHVRENVLTPEQAKKLGYSIKNKHFHGLGVKTYLEIIDSMDNPVSVYQYTSKGKYNENNFIVLTPIEIDGKKAIVPIEINNNPGQYNNIQIDYNKVKTAYFKDNTNYIQNLLNEGKIKEIFTGSNSQQTSLSTDNISQNDTKVNDISINSNMQESEKNTQELDNSSFSIEENYRGSHQIENAKPITKLNVDDITAKIMDVDGYLTKQNESDLRKLKKILNNPNEKVTIYRAAPVNELNNGDWVTTDRSYAQNVANNNGGKVYSYEVNANELYYPDNVNDLPSLHRLSSFQYNENTQNNVKYSISQDNQGNEVAPGMQKYMVDSMARVDEDLNKPLVRVYHTTTDEIPQFNEFNPVGTKYYRFGDQVVNYYTDSKDMSGSYASQDYKMADTKKLNNVEELEKYLKHIGNLTGNDYKFSKINSIYGVTQDKQISKEAREFIKTLSESEKQQMLDNIYDDEQMRELDPNYSRVFSWDKFDKELQNKYKSLTEKYIGTADTVAIQQEVMKYLESPVFMNEDERLGGEIVGTYDTEEELLKNIKTDLQKQDWSKNSKLQYEGYVNITNPYIVDAEKRNWNQVISESNDFIDELDERIPQEIKNNLTRLYNESSNKSNEARDNYNNYQEIIRYISNEVLTPEIDDDIRKMNHVIQRVGIDDITKLSNGATSNLGVSTWYTLADVLKQEDVIGSATSSFITDEFRLPQNVKEWIDTNLYGEINYKGIKNLKELYDNNSKAYEELDKYRMPNSYFLESVSKDSSEPGYVDMGYDLNDMFETRAEIYGADQVVEEIAQAASVGFSKPELIRLWGTSKTTNDIVKEIIASNKDGNTNYDGVIIKNVVDYGGHSETGTKPNNLYITFASNQFKAADNENPTSDPDIRYSISNQNEDIAPIGNYRIKGEDIKLQDIAPIETKQEVKEATKPKVETSKKEEIELPFDYEEPLEVKGLDSKTINKITNNLKSELSLNAYETKEFKNVLSDISKNDNITKEEISNLIEKKFGEKTLKVRIDEIADIKKELRNTKIFVPDYVKIDIPDYSDFRQKNYGKIQFSKEGMAIDKVYDELAEMYPEYFDKEISNEADQLQEIARVANLDKYITNTEYLDEERINKAAEWIYDSIEDYSMQKQVEEGSLGYNEYLEKTKQNDTQFKRKATIKQNRELAAEYLDNMVSWKDTPLFKQKINTMKRNLRDIMSKSEADTLYNEYFAPISKNNATIERETKKYNNIIDKLNLNKNESTAVQLLGELKYNPETTLTKEEVYDFINKHNLNETKLDNAVNTFRSVYDELFGKVNKVLEDNGYTPIGYKKGYFPHFTEEHGKNILGKLAEKLGWQFNSQKLPTDIAGLTDTFTPGKKWVSFAQHRTGDVTDYNALKGFDNYIRGAMQVIHHTEDIQKLRGLENEIRYQYSEKGVKEKLDKIFNNDELDTEEKQNQIDTLLQGYNSGLGNFVMNLREYTNNLAGKKSALDRSVEFTMGRNIYNTMNNISSRLSANMVGLNLGSAFTNFIPITQAWSQLPTSKILKATKQTIANSVRSDGFIEKSNYLTTRIDTADKLYKTGLEKVSDKANVLFDAIDSFSSQVIVRAKYLDNIAKGMSESEAINNADEFAKDVMAGRAQGDKPTIFNSTSPITKLFTAFQLEVNNQYGYMFKDLPNDLKDKGMGMLVGAFIKMFLGAWLYNKMSEELTGRKSAFSPVDIVADSVKTMQREDLDDYSKISSIAKDISDESPFISGLLGGGRLPISSAIPDIPTLTENIINLKDEEKKDKAIKGIQKELEKPLFYVVMPFGGGQLKKTKDAISMYNEDLPVAGSYTDSGNLRFTADETPEGKLKAFLFGQYSSKEAQEYVESGYKSIPSKKIQELKDLDMSASEYRKYSNDLKSAGTTNAAKIDFISNSNYTDKQKNIMAKNVLNKDIDMKKYKNYGSYEEADYAINNPEKYLLSKVTSNTFNGYKNYVKDLNSIKADKDSNGKSISNSRKNKVLDYINNLNEDYGSKLILYKMEYPSDNSYNSEIVDYLNNKDNITLNEEKKILSYLGMTVTDDGSVRW